MHSLYTTLGTLFAFLAVFFLAGLLKPFARRFYPGMPGVLARSTAPVIFACLAIACFRGAGLSALLFVVVVGIAQIINSRINRPKQKIPA